MEKEASLKLSGYISGCITDGEAVVEYTDGDIREDFKKYTKEQLEALEKEGFYDGNFTKLHILKKLCDKLDLWSYADEEYLKKMFSQAMVLDGKEFEKDPYLSNIKVPTVNKGNILLTNACYEKGEFFQYDMPRLSEDIVVPRLGCFDRRVFFPCVYEGNMPWVSVCPSEINSMSIDFDKARGRCLVLGLGLGYYPYIISQSDKVKSITIVELNERIIVLFEKYILPQFAHRDKIKIVHGDAIEYMKNVERDEFDFCYADIWEGQVDGAPLYLQIKKNESRLPYTEFAYWIEEEIKWYIDNMM